MNPKTLLLNAGHEEILDIQQECIHAVQSHVDVILLSKTGSGKTFAFLLAVLSKLKPKENTVQALIISPTRELSQQIDTSFKSLKTGLKSTLCYGGHAMKDELNSLSQTPNFVIGTPGRILDHLSRGSIDLSSCHFLVIDEYDKCLEFGFQEDMENIIQELPINASKILVSATEHNYLPRTIAPEKSYVINNLDQLRNMSAKELGVRYSDSIFNVLTDLLYSFGKERSIVFCNYREITEDLVQRLKETRIQSTYYHGGLEQDERERALIKFRNGSSNTLICTDLGARGLDIPEIKHVVHYQYPGSHSAYIHRKGRTARMTADGSSYLFIGPESQLPEYLQEPSDFYTPLNKKDVMPDWKTIYFGGGKKEKINKIDIVGFLSKIGKLSPDEIGLIEVQDHSSYVAVRRDKINAALKLVRDQKIKGKRIKIALSK